MNDVDITITINTGNAAFSDDPGAETARILRALADKFEAGRGGDVSKLMDANGNKVGTVSISE